MKSHVLLPRCSLWPVSSPLKQPLSILTSCFWWLTLYCRITCILCHFFQFLSLDVICWSLLIYPCCTPLPPSICLFLTSSHPFSRVVFWDIFPTIFWPLIFIFPLCSVIFVIVYCLSSYVERSFVLFTAFPDLQTSAWLTAAK